MNGNLPLVSAIVPTYNRAGVVGDAVESILAQTYPNVEVIVVDDGSSDDTQDVLSRYGDRIRVVTQKNAGPSAARNRGLDQARGEFVAFLDSDDLWLPTKLERQVALMNRGGESVVCCLCNVLMRWSDGARSSFEIAGLNPTCQEGLWLNADEVLATRFVLFNQGIMIRRDVLTRVGGFDESLRFMEDYELPLRLSLEGKWTFIREPLAVWRETKGSLYGIHRRDEVRHQECLLSVYEKHLATLARDARYAPVEKHVGKSIRSAQRKLTAARLGSMDSLSARTLSRVMDTVERFRGGIYRRSPWFPGMKVAALT